MLAKNLSTQNSNEILSEDYEKKITLAKNTVAKNTVAKNTVAKNTVAKNLSSH
jgi:hypothetical protein